IYTLSDPRQVILKKLAKQLSEEKGMEEEFYLYERIESISKDMILERHKGRKPVCSNVDMYSGFVYKMLGIPKELFTPIFAVSRISGWSAHRLEELVNKGKIIRPAYMYVGKHREIDKD
ncbi:MAG: citrate synthase, partial [Eubacterium sp.]|nr:citrate synthase [Eubacterium sp.]